mgnify:CR=1 FL=1
MVGSFNTLSKKDNNIRKLSASLENIQLPFDYKQPEIHVILVCYTFWHLLRNLRQIEKRYGWGTILVNHQRTIKLVCF